MIRDELYKIIGYVILNIFFISGVAAQSLYTEYEVLTNDTLISEPYTGVSEMVVFYPKNGSLRLQKLQGNQFEFRYIPSEDFIGQDTFTLEYLTEYRGSLKYLHAVINVSESFVYAYDDFAVLEMNSDYSYVDVLSNDYSTSGEIFISGFPFRDNLYVDVSNGLDSVFVKPVAGYAGPARLIYQVCDDLNNCSTASLNILVVDPEAETSSDSLYLQTSSNKSVNFYMSETGIELSVTPSLGVVDEFFDGYMHTYSPFQNIDGKDTLVYSNGLNSKTVFIEIIKEQWINTFVVDDYFYAYPGDTIFFDVFDNDLVKNGSIRNYVNPTRGELTRIRNGEFSYVAPETPGLYSFTYQACIGSNNCEIGFVSLYVGTLAPEGLYRYNLATLKNRPFVINYDIPLSNFNFVVSQAPQNGSIQIYEGFDTLNIGCEAVKGYNLVTYTPNHNFTGTDLFELQFCAQNDECQTVKVEMVVVDKELDPESCICVNNCVWPGDMNADGKVDMLDLLTFGWHLGERGDERPFADKHSWHAQFSPNWKKESIFGSDLKHLDSDGNGVVEQNDIAAIEEFFNKRNDIAPPTKPAIKEFPINLRYKGTEAPEVGDYVEFDIVAGNEQYPANFLHGLSLRYDVDPMTVDTSSLDLWFTTESFISYDASVASLSIRDGRTINSGITRLDKFAPSGYGAIATLGFVIEDELDGVYTDKYLPVRIQMNNSHLVDGFGNVYEIVSEEYVLNVRTDKVENRKQKLSVFPNPAQSGQQINARFNPVKSDAEISVYAMDGSLIHREIVSEGTYSYEYTHSLNGGVYIMTIKENDVIATQKFIIAR